MNNYKEPEMDEVKLEDENLNEVSGGGPLCSPLALPNDGKKCGGYFCVADSGCSPIA